MLRMARTVLHGPTREDETYGANVTDASAWRKVPYALLLACLLVFGFFPSLLTDKIKPVTEQIVTLATVKAGGVVMHNVGLDRPHPGPLPQERENHSQSQAAPSGGDRSSDFGTRRDSRTLSPLPGGECQGEGERANISNRSQRLLTSAATKSE